jgi:calcium-translocating P-type ATPase
LSGNISTVKPAAVALDLAVVHSSSGRLRVHLPHWSGKGGRQITAALRRLPGVTSAQANHITSNILVLFKPRQTTADSLIAALRALRLDLRAAPDPEKYDTRFAVVDEEVGGQRRARIPVRGLHRDPTLAHRVVRSLESTPGVHAHASPLTGGVMVDYDHKLIHLEDLLAEVARLELPVLPGEDQPAHPLDPLPLVRSATRAIGALVGLSFVTVQGLVSPATQGHPTAATVAGLLNLFQAFPAVRKGLHRILGVTGAEVAAHGFTIVALTVADIPLGLVLAGAEALLLLSVVTQRRAAWRRYEDGVDCSTLTAPGAVIRLEPGMRVPHLARVVEGTGTALGRSGRILPVAPGLRVPAGARVSGGPFVLELLDSEAFVPQPRPAPPRLDLHRHYVRIAAPASFAYAALVGLATGSLARAFEALLLVNPYPALVGAESANLSASARALRAGLTIVGSRPKRAIHRPDVVLIDGPRVLTDSLEMSAVLPVDEALDVPELLSLAGAVAVAAGAPWGGVFPSAGHQPATEGCFNDLSASATVGGVRYLLGPTHEPLDIDQAVELRQRGGYLLMLAREDNGQGLGLVALRPRREVLPGEPVLEITTVLPLDENLDAPQLLALAGGVASAAGSAWAELFSPASNVPATAGSFNGLWAAASVQGVRYTLGPPEDPPDISVAVERRAQGGYLLVLSREEDSRQLGFVTLRPRLSQGAHRLADICRRQGVRLEMLPGVASDTAQAVARRAGVSLLSKDDAASAIHSHQAQGRLVAFVSDGAHAAGPFTQCDLAIGIAGGYGGYFPAGADVLAPDLIALGDFIDAGTRRDRAVRDGVALSAVCNALGLALSLQGPLGLHVAFIPGYVAALAAMGLGLLRLRGGHRPEAVLGYLNDPRPERWGHRSVPSVLRAFHTRETGLSSAVAARRQRPRPAAEGREELLAALGKQFRAPTMSLLAGGACLTLVLGQPLNTAIISTTLSINVLAGLWQERQRSQGGEAVQRLGAPKARVLRDGATVTLSATSVVPGDVLVLMQGDRVAADARLIAAEGLEIGEATLTGESMPVVKGPHEAGDHNRIVLEGSDVTVGMGRAVVVAVGRHTRLGATAAAMNATGERESPLGARLARVLRVALPVAVTGGFITGAAELFHTGGALTQMITLGVTTALSTIPEGLPILAGVGQATVSRRLARRNTLVRRLAGIEALGRVDVACTDKTGTLTEGRLSACLVDDCQHEAAFPGPLSEELRKVLLVGALACPHPDDPLILLPHPTDCALIRAAHDAGLSDALRAPRDEEIPFDSMRRHSAARVAGRLCIKGAPERIIPRCAHMRGQPLDDAGRGELLERANRIAERGLRLLMVAEGPADTPLNDPQGLTALGFVAMTDPLRASAPGAVARCQQAGIRVLMLTGDHLGTARTIGRQSGLFTAQFGEALTAAELHDLSVAELDQRLERVAIVARASPVDKVRIIESLRRRGHIVAMTGDGVNDAPAVRLADVGVAMGRTGTEAARQAADVVLVDDDFAHLAEALVEGRSFWRNMRHALGLLLGGNAGEMGLYVGVTSAGFGAPLTATQILLVSLITDALPSLAIAMRPPQQRNLSLLAREGLAGMDASLPRDTVRRGLATGLPSLGAFLWTQATAGTVEARAVTFASIICSQLAQTVDVGHAHGMLSRSTLLAVGGSLAALGLAVGVPPVGGFLGLVAPSAQGWGTVAASSAAAVVLSRSIGMAGQIRLREWLARWTEEIRGLPATARLLLPAPAPMAALPSPAVIRTAH